MWGSFFCFVFSLFGMVVKEVRREVSIILWNEISSLGWISSVSLNHMIFKTVSEKQIAGNDAAGEFFLEKNLNVSSA